MKLYINKWDSTDRPELCANYRLKPKHHVDKISYRAKKGIRFKRSIWEANIQFSGKCLGEDIVGIIALSQNEVFQLAKLFKKDRSDAEFLKAIELSGLSD